VIKTKRGGTGDAKTSIRYSSTTAYTELQKAKYSFADARELLTLERTFQVGRGNSNPATVVRLLMLRLLPIASIRTGLIISLARQHLLSTS